MPRHKPRPKANRTRSKTSAAASPRERKSGPGLVFALVGALGTDLGHAGSRLEAELARVQYRPQPIRLSELLHGFDRWCDLPSSPIDDQIERHQRAGNELREVTGYRDAMAVLGSAEIRDHRKKMQQAGGEVPVAYLIRSLKRPEEVETLRRIYGSSLFVIAVHAPLQTRIRALSAKIARSRSSSTASEFDDRARKLIERDAEELGTDWGQNLRMTFPEADVIIDATVESEVVAQLERFIRIVFSHPFETPNVSEVAMFHAKAAALCSADLGRQVGAVIANEVGDILASGTNEVPRFGGGHYWAGDRSDSRDFARPTVDSQQRRKEMLRELLDALVREDWLDSDRLKRVGGGLAALTDVLSEKFRNTRLMNVGEFGRTVHAEMAALLDAARRGVVVKGAVLYTTTFPCHNCAKHIVAAGIQRVRFIEPYPESLADELHDDSIVVDPIDRNPNPDKLRFETFVGVTPRRFMEMFSMVKRKDARGKPLQWDPATARPRLPTSTHQLPDLAEGLVLETFWKVLHQKRLTSRESDVREPPGTRVTRSDLKRQRPDGS